MVNKILLAAVIADAFFLGSGILLLTFALVTQNDINRNPRDGREAVRDLIYETLPLPVGLVNAGFIIATFVATLPALLMPTTRGWVKVAGYMVTFCALFTMCLGVYLWNMTLTIGDDFFGTYTGLEPEVQGLIQTSFECCGYMDSSMPPFVTNPTCPSPAAAALLRGCQTSIASFANSSLDLIFTAVFGVVGVDVVFILALACLSKDRKEREWYRKVDHKPRY